MQFERFLLNDVLIDTKKMSVKVAGLWTPIEHKQLALLRLLIDKAPEPVTRDEIIEQLWPNLVVSDNSVSQLIVQLRKVLGDTSKQPLFIKTVPKIGYQCIATYSHTPSLIDKAKTPNQHIPFNWMFGGIAFGFFLALLAFLDWGSNDQTRKVEYISRITSAPGAEVQLSFSPGGRYLAYSQIGSGRSQFDLAVYDLQTQTTHTVKSTGYSEQLPAWSADGNWLLYYRFGPFSCEVRALPVNNAIELWRLNKEQHLMECDGAHEPEKIIWHSSDSLLVNRTISGEKALVRYDAHIDENAQFTLHESQILRGVQHYDVLGDSLLYSSPSDEVFKAYASLDGTVGELPDLDKISQPYFGLKQGEIVSIGGDLQLHKGAQKAVSIYKPYGKITELAIERTSGYLAHTEGTAEVNLYLFNRNKTEFQAVSSNARVDTLASISSDGMQLAYVSSAPRVDPQIDHVEIWIKHRLKATPSLLTKMPKSDKPKLLLFSSDAEYLAILSESNTLYIVNVFAKTPVAVVKENNSLSNIYWADDGKSIYYRTMESKEFKYWRYDVGSAANYLLTDADNERLPLLKKNISFDGFTMALKQYLFKVLEGRVSLEQLSNSIDLYRPALHTNGVYYVVKQGHQLSLYNFNSFMQKNEFVADIGLHLYNMNVDLGLSSTLDGNQIILNRVENLEMDIVLQKFAKP
ncbi:winged helix-turn-helix domain-containing protein [Pseudoalteromonas luteoviolacea]|uniref:winged helix-turn-helix domain-containing protein n=1 Tax=Pseudoalteromonas luteoviolacea TaxID=43657 RepID=UPI001B36F295|nr:winged helix-turn-helix domain-containing protein [Pseudoalteromonas luteoviolacea]MBQ4810862.1 winged helix-turn-helix domain-containing protein [Pseudoalteromonas luteoviolacea]